jgi:hypothetical protein
MQANHHPTRNTTPPRLQTLAAMAGLLERLDRQPLTASAAQYRAVAQQVTRLLGEAEPGAELNALLDIAPATAELYENLRYEHAGLCRAPLHHALNTELDATALIGRARARG